MDHTKFRWHDDADYKGKHYSKKDGDRTIFIMKPNTGYYGRCPNDGAQITTIFYDNNHEIVGFDIEGLNFNDKKEKS